MSTRIEDIEDARTYLVVINHEEQYSIWLKDTTLPAGWAAVGKEGTKSDCLQFIDEVWTDMRPLSLRKKMQDRSH
nr:MbtH family NRPS accessory protein [Bradyrhizobium sp. SZCCHNRI30512]